MIKIYKVRQMSGVEIPILGRDKLDALLAEVDSGKHRLIETDYGVINPASIDSITLDINRMNGIAEQVRFGHSEDAALRQFLGTHKIDEVDIKTLQA